jgi:hypothetical protein
MSSHRVIVDTDGECLRLVIDNWLLITFPNTEVAEKALFAASQLRSTWKWLVNTKLKRAVRRYMLPNGFKKMLHDSSSCFTRINICHNNCVALKIHPISIGLRSMRFRNTKISPLLFGNCVWPCSLNPVNPHRRYLMYRVRTVISRTYT